MVESTSVKIFIAAMVMMSFMCGNGKANKSYAPSDTDSIDADSTDTGSTDMDSTDMGNPRGGSIFLMNPGKAYLDPAVQGR